MIYCIKFYEIGLTPFGFVGADIKGKLYWFIEWFVNQYIRGVFKKRPNFLNSAPNSKDSALRLLSAPSVRF